MSSNPSNCMEYGSGDHYTADWGCVWLHGLVCPQSECVGLGCGPGWTPTLSAMQDATQAAYAALYKCWIVTFTFYTTQSTTSMIATGLEWVSNCLTAHQHKVGYLATGLEDQQYITAWSGTVAFPVTAATTNWNALPNDVVSASSIDSFRLQLKTFLCSTIVVTVAIYLGNYKNYSLTEIKLH